MIKAVIFDMDGVLIKSGKQWNRATINVLSRQQYGYQFDPSIMIKGIGLRTDEFIMLLQEEYNVLHGHDPLQIAQEISKEVARLITKDGQAMEGVYEALSFVRNKDITIALASSAFEVVISAVMDTLGIRSFFHTICSAEHEVKGKPDPAVYLRTSQLINVEPKDCLVIEDSLAGIMAAKNARMRRIMVGKHRHDYDTTLNISLCERCSHAHARIISLSQFNESLWRQLSEAEV